MRKLLWLLLVLSTPAFAQKISSLPAGSTPVGPELIPMVQSGATVTTTPSAIATYLQSTTGAWTALQTFGLNISIGGVIPTGVTGTGKLVFGTAPTLTGLTLGDITGSAQCLHANTAGLVTGTGVDCGSGGGGMVYPGAGIPNSTGTAWGTSYATTGTGSVVLSASPTLTGNLTVPTVNNTTVPASVTLVYAGGPLGTPSSATLTNATGLPVGGISATGTPSATTFLEGDGKWTTPSASASSITPGTTTILGATAPCFLANSTGTTSACAALGNNLAYSSNTLGVTVPNRTVTTSPTVASTDMGGVIFSNVTGGGTITIPAISTTVFANEMSLFVVNYSASTEAVSTTPTINAGGGCVTATGIPAGDAWQMVSNGTSIDCVQTVSAGGSGAPSTPAFSVQYDNAGAFGGVSLTAGALLQGTGTGAAPTATATPTLGVSGTTAGSLTLASTTAGGSATLNACSTCSSNLSFSFPNNSGGTFALANVAGTFSALQTFSSGIVVSKNGAASNSPISITGSIYTGGTGTTDFPYWYANQGATAPTTFSTSGTYLGFNAASGSTANIFDVHINGGASTASLTAAGVLTVASCSGCGTASAAFSALTGGTNTGAAMVVGTGASLTPTGTGTITSTNYLPSVNTATSGTSVTPNCTYPVVQITISTGTAFTFNAPGTCTPVNGQRMEVDVLASASGTPAYTWTTGASGDYIGSTDVALPTTGGGASLEDDFTFTYSTLVNRWKLMAYSRGY